MISTLCTAAPCLLDGDLPQQMHSAVACKSSMPYPAELWCQRDILSLTGNLRIEIQDRGGQGRGLLSVGNEPNEVLLALPFDTVFRDTEARISSCTLRLSCHELWRMGI